MVITNGRGYGGKGLEGKRMDSFVVPDTGGVIGCEGIGWGCGWEGIGWGGIG